MAAFIEKLGLFSTVDISRIGNKQVKLEKQHLEGIDNVLEIIFGMK